MTTGLEPFESTINMKPVDTLFSGLTFVYVCLAQALTAGIPAASAQIPARETAGDYSAERGETVNQLLTDWNREDICSLATTSTRDELLDGFAFAQEEFGDGLATLTLDEALFHVRCPNGETVLETMSVSPTRSKTETGVISSRIQYLGENYLSVLVTPSPVSGASYYDRMKAELQKLEDGGKELEGVLRLYRTILNFIDEKRPNGPASP